MPGLSDVYVINEWLPKELESLLLSTLRARSREFVQLRGKRTARFGGDPGPPPALEELPDWLSKLCSVVGRALERTLLQQNCRDVKGGEAAKEEHDAPAFANPSAEGGNRDISRRGQEDHELAACERDCAYPNHVLVNHYKPGEGILPHTDGPAYDPWAAILSLGTGVVFEFWRDHAHAAANSTEKAALSLYLPPRSLLFFLSDAYSSHLHGIVDRPHDVLEASVANTAALSAGGAIAARGEATSARAEREDAEPDICRRGERFSLTLRHVQAKLGRGSLQQQKACKAACSFCSTGSLWVRNPLRRSEASSLT